MKSCKFCGKTLIKRQKVFCSHSHSNSYYKKGNDYWIGKKHSLESKSKMSIARVGKYKANENPNWKGGQVSSGNGYILEYDSKHLYKDKRNYRLQHRLVIEKKIGRKLQKNEYVHHINGIKTDNILKNLILTNPVDHKRIYHPEVGIETRYG